MPKAESQPGCGCGWHKGPLPEDTWNWGGVVVIGEESGHGFYFADFRGDHVILCGKTSHGEDARIEAANVAYYNNCLGCPGC